MNNDLISREALRKNMEFICMGIMAGTEPYNAPLTEIDNAPTVFDDKAYSDGYTQGTCDCEHAHERPQGEWQHWGSPFSDDGVVNSCVCSLCGARFVEIPDEVFNFCPQCGAKMKGGAEA